MFCGTFSAVNMKIIADNLVKQKVKMVEAEKGKRIDELNQYILDNLLYFKEKVNSMEDDRKQEWNEINKVFLSTLSIT